MQIANVLYNPKTGTLNQSSIAQPSYTHGTLNIVEESWQHTNPILHIVGVEMVYGTDWPRQILLIDPNRKMFYLMFIIIHLYYYVIYFKYIHCLK
jgi:hypothetical protein